MLDLTLNKSIEPLPVNSTFAIRLKGAIGLKYLAITPGTLAAHVRERRDRAARPDERRGRPRPGAVDVQPADPHGRACASTVGSATALAGRGIDINDAIGAFVPLVTDLGPVARNLASPKTDLAGFFRGLEAFSGALAPVANTQATLFANLDTHVHGARERRGPVPPGLDLATRRRRSAR